MVMKNGKHIYITIEPLKIKTRSVASSLCLSNFHFAVGTLCADEREPWAKQLGRHFGANEKVRL